ncbi:hypothetical protein Nepgr_014705 [Nepenthes gracilis]|uniref:Uncharacterized protein n=1 Tax=Nepenthes gracilis TaxID=150966 RepID=A0AAD3SLA0_NEPGR|nr:hypothetical protein Nepgr_014705 [Nepenthes gracilis]
MFDAFAISVCGTLPDEALWASRNERCSGRFDVKSGFDRDPLRPCWFFLEDAEHFEDRDCRFSLLKVLPAHRCFVVGNGLFLCGSGRPIVGDFIKLPIVFWAGLVGCGRSHLTPVADLICRLRQISLVILPISVGVSASFADLICSGVLVPIAGLCCDQKWLMLGLLAQHCYSICLLSWSLLLLVPADVTTSPSAGPVVLWFYFAITIANVVEMEYIDGGCADREGDPDVTIRIVLVLAVFLSPVPVVGSANLKWGLSNLVFLFAALGIQTVMCSRLGCIHVIAPATESQPPSRNRHQLPCSTTREQHQIQRLAPASANLQQEQRPPANGISNEQGTLQQRAKFQHRQQQDSIRMQQPPAFKIASSRKKNNSIKGQRAAAS